MAKVTIDADFFEHLLNCMANQRFIGEAPVNGDALATGIETRQELEKANQSVIDDAYSDAMCILLGKQFVPRTPMLRERMARS